MNSRKNVAEVTKKLGEINSPQTPLRFAEPT